MIAAAGSLAVGIWLLTDFWHGRPVAAAFTRVGGETRVETAVEASHFWLTPPRRIVTASADASQEIMLGATRCAMVYDAPLLFTSRDPKRQQLVDVTINAWQNAAAGSAYREVILNQRDVMRCLSNVSPADVNRLPDVSLPSQPLWLSRVADLAPLIYPARGRPASPLISRASARPNPLVTVPHDERLAPVVVFAAAKAPGDSPDVAVGLALAAHMATTDRQVSLVVVPRYLEADHKLETQIRKQRQMVTGGIVLGWPRVLSEHTRALLRQLLTSTDRQGFLNEVRTSLGSVEPFVAALLALLGAGTLIRKGPETVRYVKERRVKKRDHRHWFQKMLLSARTLIRKGLETVRNLWATFQKNWRSFWSRPKIKVSSPATYTPTTFTSYVRLHIEAKPGRESAKQLQAFLVSCVPAPRLGGERKLADPKLRIPLRWPSEGSMATDLPAGKDSFLDILEIRANNHSIEGTFLTPDPTPTEGYKLLASDKPYKVTVQITGRNIRPKRRKFKVALSPRVGKPQWRRFFDIHTEQGVPSAPDRGIRECTRGRGVPYRQDRQTIPVLADAVVIPDPFIRQRAHLTTPE